MAVAADGAGVREGDRRLTSTVDAELGEVVGGSMVGGRRKREREKAISMAGAVSCVRTEWEDGRERGERWWGPCLASLFG